MRRLVIVAAILAVAGFTMASLLVYHFRPTAGTVFLSLGWVSILATGYQGYVAQEFIPASGLDPFQSLAQAFRLCDV